VEQLQVVAVADRALDQAQVDVLGILLHIDDRAVHQVHLAGEFDEELVEIEE
jgi:hypothetical protein